MVLLNNTIDYISNLRIQKMISQGAVAKAAGWKNGQFVSNYERKKCNVPLRKLKLICTFLEADMVHVAKLMSEDFHTNISKLLLDPTEQ